MASRVVAPIRDTSCGTVVPFTISIMRAVTIKQRVRTVVRLGVVDLEHSP